MVIDHKRSKWTPEAESRYISDMQDWEKNRAVIGPRDAQGRPLSHHMRAMLVRKEQKQK